MNRHVKRVLKASKIPETGDDAHEILKTTLSNLFESCTEDDIIAFTNLCHMSKIPSGKEDPKALVRSMSGPFLEAVKLKLSDMARHPLAAPVVQFFFMEWCFRHGHLEEDWKWIWKSKNEGDLKYRERIPLKMISGFSN